jgi:hypothetical protein
VLGVGVERSGSHRRRHIQYVRSYHLEANSYKPNHCSNTSKGDDDAISSQRPKERSLPFLQNDILFVQPGTNSSTILDNLLALREANYEKPLCVTVNLNDVTEEIAASFVETFEHYALKKKIVWNGLFIRQFDQTNDHHVQAVFTTACQLDLFGTIHLSGQVSHQTIVMNRTTASSLILAMIHKKRLEGVITQYSIYYTRPRRSYNIQRGFKKDEDKSFGPFIHLKKKTHWLSLWSNALAKAQAYRWNYPSCCFACRNVPI